MGVVAAMLIITSCEEADSDLDWGTPGLYMPQATSNAYSVPLEGNPANQNYEIDLATNTLEIFLGAYRSGSGVSSSATVNVITDADTVNQLITDGVISNAVLLPSDVYALPNDVTISSGQQFDTFRLSIDLLKLNVDYGDLIGKKLVLAVGLDGTSGIELNESLSTTVIIIDSEQFMPQIYMPQASGDGYLISADNPQDYVFDDVAKTLDVKLSVDCPGILYKGLYSVDMIIQSDIVDQWIADELISKAVMLPSDVYTLPENISVLDGESGAEFNLAIDVQKLIDNYPELGGNKLLVAVGLDNPSEYGLNESLSTTVVVINARDFMPAPPLKNLLLGGAMEEESKEYWNWIGGNEEWGYTADGPVNGEGGCLKLNEISEKKIWTSIQLEEGEQYQFSAQIKVPGGANSFWTHFCLTDIEPGQSGWDGTGEFTGLWTSSDLGLLDGDIRELGNVGWGSPYGSGLAGNGTNGVFTATSSTMYVFIKIGVCCGGTWNGSIFIDEIKVTKL